jgi:hypothetical protein
MLNDEHHCYVNEAHKKTTPDNTDFIDQGNQTDSANDS